MSESDPDEIDVPPACGNWPKCEGEHGEGTHFDFDAWRWSDSTCIWPACAEKLCES